MTSLRATSPKKKKAVKGKKKKKHAVSMAHSPAGFKSSRTQSKISDDEYLN